MATQVQIRRGTTEQNDAFTGAIGELSADTTQGRVRVHDGATPGGIPQALKSEVEAAQLSANAAASTANDAIADAATAQAAANAAQADATQALADASAAQATANAAEPALGFTPENVANKSTDGTLADNSDTKYPSQKAIKTYVDTGVYSPVVGSTLPRTTVARVLASYNIGANEPWSPGTATIASDSEAAPHFIGWGIVDVIVGVQFITPVPAPAGNAILELDFGDGNGYVELYNLDLATVPDLGGGVYVFSDQIITFYKNVCNPMSARVRTVGVDVQCAFYSVTFTVAVTAPTSYVSSTGAGQVKGGSFNVVDQADGLPIATLDPEGAVASFAYDPGSFQATVQIDQTDLTVTTGRGLKLGNAAVAETPVATHTLIVKDVNGTPYKLLCVPV